MVKKIGLLFCAVLMAMCLMTAVSARTCAGTDSHPGSTHQTDLRVNIRSFGDDGGRIDAYLIRGGQVYRLNQANGNDTFVHFVAVQNDIYTLKIVKAGHVPYYKTVYLYGPSEYREMNATLWLTGDRNRDGKVDYKDFFCWGVFPVMSIK